MNTMSRRGILAGVATMAAVATVGTQTAAAETGAGDVRILGETGRTYRLISGVLRNTGSGWAWINDSGHRPSGFKAVTQTSGKITLPYSFKGLRVSSLQVTPDEYYASRGLRVGASVGLSSADLYLYSGDPHSIGDYVYFNGSKWVSDNDVFSGLSYNGAGVLTLTHEAMGTGAGVYAAVTQRGQALASAGNCTNTTTQVAFYTGSFGALVPTGAANGAQHRAWVSRHGTRNVPAADPDSVSAQSGNLWVTGLIEV